MTAGTSGEIVFLPRRGYCKENKDLGQCIALCVSQLELESKYCMLANSLTSVPEHSRHRRSGGAGAVMQQQRLRIEFQNAPPRRGGGGAKHAYLSSHIPS